VGGRPALASTAPQRFRP